MLKTTPDPPAESQARPALRTRSSSQESAREPDTDASLHGTLQPGCPRWMRSLDAGAGLPEHLRPLPPHPSSRLELTPSARSELIWAPSLPSAPSLALWLPPWRPRPLPDSGDLGQLGAFTPRALFRGTPASVVSICYTQGVGGAAGHGPAEDGMFPSPSWRPV